MASQQPTQLPPPSVGTPFSETVGGLASSSDAYSKTAPDTSVHATAPGPPLGSRNPYVVQASDVPAGAGTQPTSVSAIPPPQLGAASSAAQPGGLSNYGTSTQHGSSTHQQGGVTSSLPSTGQVADRAQQAKDSAAQTGAQAGAAIGSAAQSAKATIQSAELPAAPAQRPEGVSRLESQDGVKVRRSLSRDVAHRSEHHLGHRRHPRLCVLPLTRPLADAAAAPGAALEAVANKAGHPEIAQQIQVRRVVV